jgi:integrase
VTPTLFKRCNCAREDKPCDHAYWYEFRLCGQRYRKSTRTDLKEDARKIAVEARRCANRDRTGIAASASHHAEPKEPPLRLAEFAVTYLEWAEQDHPASSNVTGRVLLSFVDVIGDSKRLDEIGPFDIERWRMAQTRHLSRSTVNRRLTIIRALFSKAVAWRKLTASPVNGITPFRVDDTRIRVLSTEEIGVVLTRLPPDYALMCWVTLESLLRLSEVLGIRKEHIGSSWVEVRRKGGKVDRIVITPELREALLAQAHPRTGWVFGPRQRRQEVVSARFTYEFRKIGLRGVSHHVMRHTGVTLMLEAGINPTVIQRLAGWTSLRMLMRYGHVRDSEMRRAIGVPASVIAAAIRRRNASDQSNVVLPFPGGARLNEEPEIGADASIQSLVDPGLSAD